MTILVLSDWGVLATPSRLVRGMRCTYQTCLIRQSLTVMNPTKGIVETIEKYLAIPSGVEVSKET